MVDNKRITDIMKRCQRLFKFQNNYCQFLKLPILHSKGAGFAFQNCQFCILKLPVLHSKMVRFAIQNGAFCNPFAVKCGSASHQVNGGLLVFDMRNIVSEMSVLRPLHRKMPPIALHKYAKPCIFMQKQSQKCLFLSIQNVNFLVHI